MSENTSTETIAAIATAPGKGGVGVIRISGPESAEIARQLVGELPTPRLAACRDFVGRQSAPIDQGLVLYFPKPHSFTGEDVIELQGHGGPVIMQMLLEEVLAHGAKLAAPGEFTQRAFLNGKIDLAQAEAVADLIDASTQAAARGALRSLQGAFSDSIHLLSEKILNLRILVEAGIDFPDEEVDLISDYRLSDQIQSIQQDLKVLLQQARQGQLLKEGIAIAIVGQPNAGKSSLLNYLTQENTAIVTSFPGTTRDLVKASIQIDGIPVQLVDTAGIRAEADEIEQLGIARSKEQQKLVDVIILLADVTLTELSDVERDILEEYSDKVILVFNKRDLIAELPHILPPGAFCISAKTGEGIPDMLSDIKRRVGGVDEQGGAFISRQRHMDALLRTRTHIEEANKQLCHYRAFELSAEELRYAHQTLGEIVGHLSSDALLGEIFSHFCIGK